MFFFIAGIQPKTVHLDNTPGMCRSCGLFQARLKRVDHYLSIFFIPIIRVKKGHSVLECQSCGSLFQESGEMHSRPQEKPRKCSHCGKDLKPAFRYCPHCGKKM